MIYIQQGEFKKAIPVLTKVIELGGGDGLLYGFLGYAYSSMENSISAESAYRMAIMLDSQTLDWKMGLARSFFRQQRYSEAAALCDILLKKYPDRSDLWLLQANAYIGLNKPVKAAEIFEMVNQLGKSSVASLNLLGDIYVNEQLFDLAVDSYIMAMEKEQDAKPDRAIRSCKVLAARGAHEQTNKLIEYIEANKADLLSKEERKDLLKLRARLAVASGNADKEIEILEKIVEIDPLDGEALLLLGQHSKKSGDMETAVYYYQRAQNIEEFESDALVRHAQLLVMQGKYSDAVTLLRRAQQIEHRENIQKYLEQVERVAKGR
jgi:tetratricopeptide (TPR) repeat protein